MNGGAMAWIGDVHTHGFNSHPIALPLIAMCSVGHGRRVIGNEALTRTHKSGEVILCTPNPHRIAVNGGWDEIRQTN